METLLTEFGTLLSFCIVSFILCLLSILSLQDPLDFLFLAVS